MKKMYRYYEYFQCSPCIEEYYCKEHGMPRYPGDEASAMIDEVEVEDHVECTKCRHARRDGAFKENKIQWSLLCNGELIFSSKDKTKFWDFFRTNRAEFNKPMYQIKEEY